MGHRNPDALIHDLAARQHGVVARSQLLAAGVSAGAVRHRLRKRTLRPLHRGVYQTGPVTGRYNPEMAAALACGPQAALSHGTAGAIWTMMPPRQREAPVDVAGPRSLRGPVSGVRLHRVPRMESDEVTRKHELPLTTPARTILDLASHLGPAELERVLARALQQSLVDGQSLEVLLLRYPHRRGCRTLRTLLDEAGGPALTRSEAEAAFLALLRKGDVPRPVANARVSGMEVDFFWPDRGIVVEIDGFAYHSHRGAFENDRRRDGILVAGNLSVVRFTWRQIHNEPEKVLARLCMALGARTGTRAPSDWRPAARGP